MTLVLDRLSVQIGDRLLVTGVSLAIAGGEAVALVGASGSGKSLTAAALTGSLPGGARTTGQLEVLGRSTSFATRRRPGIAAVRQDSFTALHPLVRIDRQLVPVLLRSGAAPTQASAQSLAASMLDDVGFSDPVSVLRSFPMDDSQQLKPPTMQRLGPKVVGASRVIDRHVQSLGNGTPAFALVACQGDGGG